MAKWEKNNMRANNINIIHEIGIVIRVSPHLSEGSAIHDAVQTGGLIEERHIVIDQPFANVQLIIVMTLFSDPRGRSEKILVVFRNCQNR